MKKLVVIGFLMSATLVACGGKNKATTTPDNKGGSAEMKAGATGGAGYGNAKKTPGSMPAGDGASADPCAGGK